MVKENKGHIKAGEVRNPNGRPKVKKNFQALMRKKIEDAGVIDVMIETALNVDKPRIQYDVDDKDRLALLRTLATKCLPDLKAMELSGDSDRPLVILKDFTGCDGKSDT